MPTTVPGLFVSLALSCAGFGVYMYGKKQRRGPPLTAGILLMAFPYFVSTVAWMLCGAGAIVAGLWLAIRMGL